MKYFYWIYLFSFCFTANKNLLATADENIESLRPAVLKALKKGAKFLLKKQNNDGSWGSADIKLAKVENFGWDSHDISSHQGAKLACTNIGATALMNYPYRDQEIDQAISRAINYSLTHWHLPYSGGRATMNIWGYLYNLKFLCYLLESSEGKAYQKRIHQVIPKVIKRLALHQQNEGGWSYYAKPDKSTNTLSFLAAEGVLGLTHAKKIGFDVPTGLLTNTVQVLTRSKFEDGNYSYGPYNAQRVRHRLEILGNIGRTQICNLALYQYSLLLKNDLLSQEAVITMNKKLYQQGHYLYAGRKRLIPHRDMPDNISGYFFFYAYYYSSEIMMLFERNVFAEQWEQLAKLMIKTQERNGSWFDTPAYDYGDKWGTGMALSCLNRLYKKWYSN